MRDVPFYPLLSVQPKSVPMGMKAEMVRSRTGEESASPSMTYVTNLESNKKGMHKSKSGNWSSWQKGLAPLSSALKTVRASLSPRPVTPSPKNLFAVQRNDDWDYEIDEEPSMDSSAVSTVESLNVGSNALPKSPQEAISEQEESGRRGLKELLAQKRAEKSRRKREEELKRNIKYVAVVDPAKVKYDVKPDGNWI
jgi:hypothetical protein